MFNEYQEPFVSREQILFAAILHQVIYDLCQPWVYANGVDGLRVRSRATRDAILWIGDYPSRDFREISWLAGCDPSVIHPILAARRFWPEADLLNWRRRMFANPETPEKKQKRLLRKGRAA